MATLKFFYHVTPQSGYYTHKYTQVSKDFFMEMAFRDGLDGRYTKSDIDSCDYYMASEYLRDENGNEDTEEV